MTCARFAGSRAGSARTLASAAGTVLLVILLDGLTFSHKLDLASCERKEDFGLFTVIPSLYLVPGR